MPESGRSVVNSRRLILSSNPERSRPYCPENRYNSIGYLRPKPPNPAINNLRTLSRLLAICCASCGKLCSRSLNTWRFTERTRHSWIALHVNGCGMPHKSATSPTLWPGRHRPIARDEPMSATESSCRFDETAYRRKPEAPSSSNRKCTHLNFTILKSTFFAHNLVFST